MAPPNDLEHFSPFDLNELWTLLNSTTNGVFMWDSKKDSVFWSSAFAELLGRKSQETFTFNMFHDLIHPEDQKRHRDVVFFSKNKNLKYSIQVKLQHQEGHYISAKANGLWMEKDGNPYLVSYFFDVTKDVEAHLALERSRARFQTFLDNCPATVYIKDKNSRHLYVNDKTSLFLNRDIDEILNKKTHELFENPSAQWIDDIEKEVLKENKTLTWSGPISSKNGKQRYFVDTKFPVIDPESGETVVAGFGIDITEQRNAIMRANHKQRLESLGVFAGGIAHDLNNHLTVILQAARNIEKLADSQTLADLYKIVDACHMSADLCRQVLGYAGEDFGPVATFNVKEFIESSKGFLEMSTQPLTLELDLNDGLIDISRPQMHQILLNLIINAVEANCRSSIKVDSSLIDKKHIPEHNYFTEWFNDNCDDFVVVKVSDDGEGIKSGDLSVIFEPFFTTKEEGSGMGLASVLGIVRTLNGGIGVNTVSGEGAQFYIYFPKSKSNEATVFEIEKKSQPIHFELDRSVLVVDDEELVAEAIGDFLDEIGLSHQEVFSGKAAIEKLKADPQGFDLITLDLTMPGMNGLETLKEIRKISPAQPVVLMSGYSSAQYSHLLDSKTQFVMKPFKFEQLQEIIGDFLTPNVRIL